jgi:hypothetical protein
MIGRNANVPDTTGSNQIAIGTSAETMYIQGGFNWRVGSINSSISFITTLTAPLAQFYGVIMQTVNAEIILPSPGDPNVIGATVTFKRLGSGPQDFIIKAAGGGTFVPINNFAAVASITVLSSIFQVTLVSNSGFWCVINYV